MVAAAAVVVVVTTDGGGGSEAGGDGEDTGDDDDLCFMIASAIVSRIVTLNPKPCKFQPNLKLCVLRRKSRTLKSQTRNPAAKDPKHNKTDPATKIHNPC